MLTKKYGTNTKYKHTVTEITIYNVSEGIGGQYVDSSHYLIVYIAR